MRPSCGGMSRPHAACDHEGYVHAESLEQVQHALESGDVWDSDADVVCAVAEFAHGSGYEVSYWFEGNRGDIRTYDLRLEEIGYILIPEGWDYEPVTEEELGEVYKILGVADET